ncbi:hypothetical protein HHK36_006949 [Tetracentron sinense]|uniref:Uncharacterized protein n=1 Tax=Tetracentron sinense TaxID=13715 RepID=A0A834ZMG3_TETSI|nr:hypothetical protein HHK36_006949 [Tetracentron sinense]
MHTINSTSFSSPSPSSSFEVTELKSQNFDIKSPSFIIERSWRPDAQRNLINQWSKLASCKQQWFSASSIGMSHAKDLVKALLSQRNVPFMDMGGLSDLLDIRMLSCIKLAQQQEVHRSKLLSSYKDLVVIVTQMINISSSMRRFLKGSASSSLVQFSCSSDDKNDGGDGGGIPVFKFWSIPYFEIYAQELVEMFTQALSVKRCLMVELLSVHCEKDSLQSDGRRWSDELYDGEFDHLSICNLYSTETCELVLPTIPCWESHSSMTVPSNPRLEDDVLKVRGCRYN